ncbi:iron donor protein CyaY [Marinobacterium litorale]|uniref:iron donor protein CyaY n=1 Tax=Marinobacterium litorale TaxID=404770 RepID=UPI00041F3F17|nr:iron donor protein CyaY [Marinobacterium litorale]
MTESEFMSRVDETLTRVEEILDEADTDIDCEINGGMMTVKCENGSQIIFTRQPPLKQLWLATREGGFHFDYDNERSAWIRDSDSKPLDQVLSHAFAEQAGEQFDFTGL